MDNIHRHFRHVSTILKQHVSVPILRKGSAVMDARVLGDKVYRGAIPRFPHSHFVQFPINEGGRRVQVQFSGRLLQRGLPINCTRFNGNIFSSHPYRRFVMRKTQSTMATRLKSGGSYLKQGVPYEGYAIRFFWLPFRFNSRLFTPLHFPRNNHGSTCVLFQLNSKHQTISRSSEVTRTTPRVRFLLPHVE